MNGKRIEGIGSIDITDEDAILMFPSTAVNVSMLQTYTAQEIAAKTNLIIPLSSETNMGGKIVANCANPLLITAQT
jgi:hypothetical protein